jgi:hypothetical protein
MGLEAFDWLLMHITLCVCVSVQHTSQGVHFKQYVVEAQGDNWITVYTHTESRAESLRHKCLHSECCAAVCIELSYNIILLLATAPPPPPRELAAFTPLYVLYPHLMSLAAFK